MSQIRIPLRIRSENPSQSTHQLVKEIRAGLPQMAADLNLTGVALETEETFPVDVQTIVVFILATLATEVTKEAGKDIWKYIKEKHRSAQIEIAKEQGSGDDHP